MELEHLQLAALLLTTESDLRQAREELDGSEESRLRHVAAQARAVAAWSVTGELLMADSPAAWA